jgi:hypothetical protein
MNLFEERNFIQPMGNAIMLSGCLGFFPFKFWVYGWEVGGEVIFSNVCGVESGLSRVDIRLSMQVLLGGGGHEGKIYFPFSQ